MVGTVALLEVACGGAVVKVALVQVVAAIGSHGGAVGRGGVHLSHGPPEQSRAATTVRSATETKER